MSDKVVQEFVLRYKTEGEPFLEKAKKNLQALYSKVDAINKNIETQEKKLASGATGRARQTLEGNIKASHAAQKKAYADILALEKQLGGVQALNAQKKMEHMRQVQLLLAKSQRYYVNEGELPGKKSQRGMGLDEMRQFELMRRRRVDEYLRLKNVRAQDIIRYSDDPMEIDRERKGIIRRSGWIKENSRLMRENESQAKASAKAHSRMMEQYQKLDPLHQFNRSLEKLNTVFVRVRDAFISFAILRATQMIIGGFFRTIVDANATMEELDARLSVMTGGGGAFERLRQHILDITVFTPFVIKDFVEATVALTAFGLNAEKYLLPLADWASAVGKDINDVALAFAKVARGSPRTALLLSTRGISKAEFDAEVKLIGDKATALANIIKRKFAGMSETVSRTFKGLLTNVSDMWFQIAMKIGEPLFVELKDDIRELYLTLDKWRKMPPDWLIFLGRAVAFLYDNLKRLSALLAGFIIVKALRAMATGMVALVAWVMKGARSLAYFKEALDVARSTSNFTTKVGRIAVLMTPLLNILTTIGATIGLVIFESNRLSDVWVRTRTRAIELADAIRETGMGSDRVKNLIEDQIRDLEEYISTYSKLMRRLGASLAMFWEIIKPVWLGKNLNFQSEIDFFNKSEEMSVRDLEIARKRLEVAKVLNEERRIALQLMKESIDIEEGALAIAKALEGRGPAAKAWLAAALGQLNTLIAEYEKKVAKPVAPPGFTATSEVKAQHEAAKQMLAVFVQLREVILLGGQDIKKIQAELQKRINKNEWLRNFFTSTENATTGVEALVDILMKFFDVTKKGGEDSGSTYIDRIDEIIRLRERLQELIEGESTLEAKIAGNKAFIISQRERIYGPYSQEDEIALLKAKIAILEGEAKQVEQLADAKRRLADATNELIEAEAQANVARIERLYEETADIEGYRAALLKQIQSLEEKRWNKEFEKKMYAELAEDFAENEVLFNKYRTNSEIAAKGALETAEKIEEIKKKLYELASKSLGEAFTKALTQLQHTLNSFFDTLASTVVRETQDLIVDLTNMFLDFITAQEETNETVEKARRELEALYREREFQTQQLNQLRRRVDETNEEYLSRIASLQQLQAQEVMIYEYKTRELELLQQINEAEQERNNILLERLKQFGQAIFDEFIRQAAGSLITGIFGGGGKIGGSDPGPGVPYEPIPNYTRPAGGGLVVQVTGPVYGFDDFERKVDTAVRNVNSRRSR